jgi:hypothetical protein
MALLFSHALIILAADAGRFNLSILCCNIRRHVELDLRLAETRCEIHQVLADGFVLVIFPALSGDHCRSGCPICIRVIQQLDETIDLFLALFREMKGTICTWLIFRLKIYLIHMLQRAYSFQEVDECMFVLLHGYKLSSVVIDFPGPNPPQLQRRRRRYLTPELSCTRVDAFTTIRLTTSLYASVLLKLVKIRKALWDGRSSTERRQDGCAKEVRISPQSSWSCFRYLLHRSLRLHGARWMRCLL